MSKILYISYDGMTDPLGQSQVIPYLQGLAKIGHEITIVSFEKKERREIEEEVKRILALNNIDWIPLSYTKDPPVLSTLFDLVKLKKTVSQVIEKKEIHIVHCRSYLSALIGSWAKKEFGTRFVFDMRGFWADERVEGGLWDQHNLIFKIIYSFFKKEEIKFLEEADHTITLTFKAKEIIHSWGGIKKNPIPISVIPCCVDLDLFNPKKIKKEDGLKLRKNLKIAEDEFVLIYLGSVGTWYMLEEMLSFFKVLKERKKDAKFLFVTKEPKELIEREVERKGIEKDAIIITTATRNEVPLYLSISSASIYFIKPTFSKQGSSPTKHGEILAMGKPIVTNSGVGDWDLFQKSEMVNFVEGFSKSFFLSVVEKIVKKEEGVKDHKEGLDYFALEKGILQIDSVYHQIHND